ncbi:T9SS type A sorting domain-containing protein [Spirosoma sp. KNUC1025]|uniref:Ig-like domain-containing protein n=1 Tax=Spirosoma sp. KNUC1025 TaxID=2894082 RepID=UPI00386BC4C8|nr:T9SS type A sorting domain-containing protein [Spirosoma sp. KNUC1025]
MSCRHYFGFLTAFVIATFNSVGYAKPIWKFGVVVAVEKRTADFYQSMLSKSIELIVREQMATVNANFNSTDRFDGVYNFQVDSIYMFDGAATDEIIRPHPNYRYCVVIDGFSVNGQGGGWLGSQQVIYHKWPWSTDFGSGPFGPGATDGLTHEFGHARGAIDIYGLRVEGSRNPVNGETFEPVNSIMNFPYGNIVWDEHTIHLLNSTGDGTIEGDQWITRPFPNTIAIKATDDEGLPVEGARLDVYPVDWFSYAVADSPVVSSETQSNGTYSFPSNPFQPTAINYPWHIRYSNFLIKATYNSSVVYKWMPLYDVQNTYFRNGTNATYIAAIQFPASTPMIRVSKVSSTTVCGDKPITITFKPSDAFEPGNVFMIQLIDQFNNSYVFSRVEGTGELTIQGDVPNLSENTYRVRIISSKPYARSNDYPITLVPTPSPPTVQAITACQNATAPLLQAVGQNLLWYTSSTGGTGSAVTPVVSTTEAGQRVYYVSQTRRGCEGLRAALVVNIKLLPAAPSVTQKTICQFAAPEAVVAEGIGLTWYNADGRVIRTTPTISTDKEAVITYQVTQTIDGCEGPRATLVVKVRPLATATLAGSQTILEGESATLSVAFTGDGPWTFSYRDSTIYGAGNVLTLSANASPYTLTCKPVKTTAYRLTSVSNSCGAGTLAGSLVIVTVNPLLGMDDPTLADQTDVFPVPATATLTVRIRGLMPKNPARLTLMNLTGQVLLQELMHTETVILPLMTYPSGTYLLRIKLGNRAATKRIVKL